MKAEEKPEEKTAKQAKNEIPKAPANAEKYDSSLKPIDNIGKHVTWNWLNSVINKVKV